jgi:hypothetical protein
MNTHGGNLGTSILVPMLMLALMAMLMMMLLFASPVQAETRSSSTLDTKVIEQAIGKPGELKDDVYKVSLPRKDLSVTLNEVQLKPGLALGTWIAFKRAGGNAVMHGDLVLTEHEVGAVFTHLRKVGIQVSALHNHLIGETPKLIFLHIEGKGDEGKMATQIKEALSLTGTPMEAQLASAATIEMSTASEEADFDADVIQKELGHKGKIKDGVLHVSVPRPEPIKLHGALLPPSMGMATVLNFQTAGGNKVAATGDFVMVSEEVDRVTKALAEHGILITALHNHLVHGWPDLYFMHFWVNDSPEKVARGLRAGLDAMKRS